MLVMQNGEKKIVAHYVSITKIINEKIKHGLRLKPKLAENLRMPEFARMNGDGKIQNVRKN